MKYFFPLLMALAILAGIGLTVTPYVAGLLFPASKTPWRTAEPLAATGALADWFAASPTDFQAVQGIEQRSAQGKTAWFTFKANRETVENFIRKNRLQQQDLTLGLMQQVFMKPPPPVDWWQPASLQRQTCFLGTDDGHELALIYDAQSQQGFLLMRQTAQTRPF